MSWFDIGNALLNQGQPAGGAPASPGSGSDYLRSVLMGGMGRAPSGLESLSPGAGAPPEMGGGDGAPGGLPGDPADSGVADGTAQGDIAAAISNAISGARSGAVGIGLNALGANPTFGFGPQGFFGSLSSNSNAAPNTFGLSLSNLMSLAPNPVGPINMALGAALGLGQGVATRGGDFSGPFGGLFGGTANAQAPGFFSGFNNSLSDAARGRGQADPDSPTVSDPTADPPGATPTQGDPTGQDSGDGPSGNGGTVGDGTAGGIGGSAPGGEGGAGIGSSGDGGGGGGGGGSSVICSELRRQGLMDDLIWAADERFGGLQTRAVRDGYRCWAQYIARGMKRSPRLTRIVSRLAIPWAHEMAYLMGARSRGSRLGRALMFAGLPFCAFLGKLRSAWRTA